MEINKKNIPLKYMIPLTGKMNKGIYTCFNYECKNNVSHRASKYNVVEDIIGFANSNVGKMVVWQCKSCGQKYFFHLRENDDIYGNSHDYVSNFHKYKTTGKWLD